MEISKTFKIGVLISLLLIQTLGILAAADDPMGLMVVVVSQKTGYHESLAKQLQSDILVQADQQGKEKPIIYMTHEKILDVQSAWTFLPLFTRLNESSAQSCLWVFFCEDRTKVRLEQLLQLLSDYDANQEVWIGFGLQDKEPTIIHHFSNSPSFQYPHLGVGFAMSATLLSSLASRLQQAGFPDDDFSIDASYELARFVFNSGRGPSLVHSSLLCMQQDTHCASYILPSKPCSEPIPVETIHFAVKTCEKFHTERIPIVKSTWAISTSNIGFYSDLKDDAIPTVNLGVPNTVRGHCGKTIAIIRHVASKHRVNWLVIADDDTLLSVARLQSLLSCYSASDTIALGERYGFNVNHPRGYNYITGGGGIVLSMPAVRLLADSCHCPSDSTPDDMYLGLCFARLNISIIHSPLFHQARPSDYAPELLSTQHPISFHKHWMMDPLVTYQDWLLEPQHMPAHIEF